MCDLARTGCAWRTTTYIYVARTSNNRVFMACELYCCLLPQCEALRSCRSVFPIARKWCCDMDVKVVRSSAFTQRTCDRCGSLWKGGDVVAASPVVLRWMCASPRTGCAWRINTIICVARESNSKRDCDVEALPILTCERLNVTTSVRKERLRAWSLLLLAATVRSFAHMPLGISDRNNSKPRLIRIRFDRRFYTV